MQTYYYEGAYPERILPGGFPSGFPSGFPGGFPSPPPTTGPSSGQQPPGPPPAFTPQLQTLHGFGQPAPFAIDPGAIRGCLFRWTYIWTRGNQQFWFFPIFVGPRSVAGFRWYGRNWGFFGINLNQILQFQCF
ncbi:hypothetical protein GCM10011391_09740 [Pullulanibacillus camelliae]|uniref:Transporter n=1 Tax=Pullulanibacillus camelliae TaxID=1707096 RepID=A0A8J2VMT3_9BACL|nr:collagen-like protein [Pullulanibacillus camelliae]GGE33136.1 hypothetical protein GCM10011391_09740 [Pullulanibacillus camelliae]